MCRLILSAVSGIHLGIIHPQAWGLVTYTLGIRGDMYDFYNKKTNFIIFTGHTFKVSNFFFANNCL